MKNTKKIFLVAALLSLTALAGCSSKKDSSSSSSSGGNAGSSSVTDSSGQGSSSSSSSVTEDKNPFDVENYANGAKSYVAASYEERTEILGLLEAYAVNHNLTGMTMYENGGYVMYDTSVVKGTNTYIPGYGFGIVSEGYINADMAYEANTNWKRYYHTYETSDPKTINYQNDKGSVVGDLISYVSGSYWTTQMNEFKDGYEWVGQLAKSERPIAVNADENGLATTYKLEVKVGSEAKYRTGSTNSTLSAYNGREVALEDYVTPYKIYYTSAYGMARGSENLSGASSIKGSAAYYNASAEGYSASAWENIGIKTSVEDGKSYLEFTFNIPCNEFYAMYYLSSPMFAPVPEDFISALGGGDFATGVKSWGNYTDSGLTPVDTWLSTGPYYIEAWNADQEIVFGKNNLFETYDEDRYKMAGVHFKILKAANEDPNAVFNEFLAGHLHAASIPSTMLDQYRNDERTTTTVGDSTFKLNFNTCTQERWEELFGVNGTITQTATSDYWECEPAMSNSDFLAGINYAFNRTAFAEKYGRTPSANYFGSGYLSNPEDGIVYNNTDAHKNAVAASQAGTEYGYNLEFAKESFKKASEALIASGVYQAGDTIHLEIAWQTASDETQFHSDVKSNLEDAFNSCGGDLTLSVDFWAGTTWSDVYYKKMMIGQFDIGFGSVSGNSLNPLNFLEVLKSDNSSGFTLNWGADTNVVSEELYYDGCYWSFDSLWQAADTGAYLVDGKVAPLFTLNDTVLSADNFELHEDGSATATLSIDLTNAENATCEVTYVELFAAVGVNEAGTEAVYDADAVDFVVSEDGKTLTITIPAELVLKYQDVLVIDGECYNFSFDIYTTSNVVGIDAESISSAMIYDPEVFPVVSAE